MKFGIIGLGSIGQRHARCLIGLGHKDITALRTGKGEIKSLPNDLSSIRECHDAGDFYSENLDGVIISNPTSMHAGSMKECISRNIPVFVEKPISGNMEQLGQIKKSHTSKVMVGFNLRHNDMISAVRKFMSSKQYGKTYKANLYCGQYLPSWHPYADYRKEYYSRKEMGGGVIRTLCHEIDLMHYFFGKPVELMASVEKLSGFYINVDDCAYLLCRMPDDSMVSIELDYLNPIATRKGAFFSSKGMLEYSMTSLSAPKSSFIDNGGKANVLYENPNLERNNMYLSQMESFVKFIKTGRNECTFEDGLNVMKVIDAAEKSGRTKKWERVM